jgi:HlyD family secretion protein
MSTMTHQIQAEPVPTKPGLIALPHAAKNFRAKWIQWTVVVGLAALVAAGALLWRAHAQNAIRYETVAVERGPIQASVTATGTLNAVVDVQVGSQVSGNIKVLYADFNTKVKKGQLVALIDPEIFQAQVAQADAAVRSAHSAVLTAEAQVQKANADFAAAMAQEKNAQAIAAKDRANALNAKIQWERADSLFRTGVISEQDHDSAKATYEAYQAQMDADQSQIDAARQVSQSAQAQVRVTESQLGTSQAQERQAQAVLQQAKTNLAHTRIVAPVDGTVVARRMDVGQTIAASFQAPTIFEIAQDLTKMQVDTNVDESDIGTIAAGQKATFTVDSYPGTTFHGVVTDIRKAPIIAQNVVTYDVVVEATNPDLKLLPGMTANVTILTAKLEDTLKVPNSVLRFRPSAVVLKRTGLPPQQAGKQQVYLVAGEKLQAVPVALGLSDGKFTAVTTSDLHPGDRVVVRATTRATSTSGSATGAMPSGPRT